MSRRKTNGNKEKQRFSIKKISGRTASVLIGFTIFGGLMLDAPKAKADTNDNYNVTTDSRSTESTSNTDKVVTLTSNADKTNQNAVDVTGQSADKMSNDSMNQDSSNTPTQGSESTATSNSTDKENVDSTTSSNENKTTDTTVTNTEQENSASNKVKLRLFAVQEANDVARADTAKPDVDDIYNYYHDKGSSISKERIQKLIDYNNNLESVTAILELDKTTYGDSWVNQALEKQIANATTLTDTFVDRIIGTFGERLVNDTNTKIDNQIEKIKTLQNQYPNSPDVKDALEKLNAAKEQVIPENIFNADKMKDVIDTLNKYGSPNAYDELAKKAEENPNGNNQALDEEKQKANDAIDKLNNLNDEQKAAAKAAVNNATDAAGVTAASDQATALDGNMGDLKESVADADTTKASGNYKNADEAAQKAYDAAVEAAKAIVAKEGTNADSTAVQAALEKVKETKAALNGDSNLANAKQKAQDAIDKLNNLNEAQKEAAKAAVNNATDAAGVTAAWSTERGARHQRLCTFEGALHGGLPPVGAVCRYGILILHSRAGRTAGGGQRNRRKIYVTENQGKDGQGQHGSHRRGARLRAHPPHHGVSRRHDRPLEQCEARRGARPREAQPVRLPKKSESDGFWIFFCPNAGLRCGGERS